MNLGDGKRKALMILDEYSSGGEITVDEDINNKMADFFDIGQKDILNVSPIIKETVIDFSVGTESQGQILCSLPSDFKSFFRIWKNGKRVSLYPMRQGKLAAPLGSTGTILVEYTAYPQTINSSTPDEYEFEVSEAAANCLPFFVASQQLITDLVVDYSAIWQMYVALRSQLSPELPSGGSGGVRQTFFRR